MKPVISDEEFRKDFADSVFSEELEFDEIPPELMAEFENSKFEVEETAPAPLSQSEDDYWGSSEFGALD